MLHRIKKGRRSSGALNVECNMINLCSYNKMPVKNFNLPQLKLIQKK